MLLPRVFVMRSENPAARFGVGDRLSRFRVFFLFAFLPAVRSVPRKKRNKNREKKSLFGGEPLIS